jgi:hypothetical protein
VDAHVFSLAEIRPLIASTHFHSPNSLEAGLQNYVHMFLPRYGLCYRAAKVVNVPWTRVQVDCDNRYDHHHTADDLLRYWEMGQRIDLQDLDGCFPNSVHQEFTLMLEPRDGAAK